MGMLDDCVSSVHLERDLEHELEEKEHNLAAKNEQLQLLHKACVNDTSRLDTENALLKHQVNAEFEALERERELHRNETKQWISAQRVMKKQVVKLQAELRK